MQSREEIFVTLQEALVELFELEAERVTLDANLYQDLELEDVEAETGAGGDTNTSALPTPSLSGSKELAEKDPEDETSSKRAKGADGASLPLNE